MGLRIPGKGAWGGSSDRAAQVLSQDTALLCVPVSSASRRAPCAAVLSCGHPGGCLGSGREQDLQQVLHIIFYLVEPATVYWCTKLTTSESYDLKRLFLGGMVLPQFLGKFSPFFFFKLQPKWRYLRCVHCRWLQLNPAWRAGKVWKCHSFCSGGNWPCPPGFHAEGAGEAAGAPRAPHRTWWCGGSGLWCSRCHGASSSVVGVQLFSSRMYR